MLSEDTHSTKNLDQTTFSVMLYCNNINSNIFLFYGFSHWDIIQYFVFIFIQNGTHSIYYTLFKLHTYLYLLFPISLLQRVSPLPTSRFFSPHVSQQVCSDLAFPIHSQA